MCGWTVPESDSAAFQLYILGNDNSELACRVCYLGTAIAGLLNTEGATRADRSLVEESLFALYHSVYDQQYTRRRASLAAAAS